MDCRSRVEVTAGFCFFWAFLILALPLRFLAAAVFAALIHELFHALAVRLLGGSVRRMTLGTGGVIMEVTAMDAWGELLCALAGPLGSLLLACMPYPDLAICGLCQGLFNLLPVMPLDGGRALGCVLEITVPQYRERISRIVETVACGALLVGAVWFGAAAAAIWLVFVFRKFPCKPGGKRVQ